MRRLVLSCTLILAAFAVPSAPSASAYGAQQVPSGSGIVPGDQALRSATRWAARRKGRVSWSVLDSAGVFHGSHGARPHFSASTSKAMLLVAALRRVGPHPIPPALAAQLRPMIRRSDNRAADAVLAFVGDAGLAGVARAAGMRHFATNGTWSNVRLTSADQARLFIRIDRLVRPRHRDYARGLLRGIVAAQSWGVPRAARPRGWRVLFKGGWREKLVNQAALLERSGTRIAIAVLTDANPSQAYGRATVQGIAERLVGK